MRKQKLEMAGIAAALGMPGEQASVTASQQAGEQAGEQASDKANGKAIGVNPTYPAPEKVLRPMTVKLNLDVRRLLLEESARRKNAGLEKWTIQDMITEALYAYLKAK